MTFFEKWKKGHPNYDWAIYEDHPVGSCPEDFGYEEHHNCNSMCCRDCWSREMPEEKTEKPVTDACFDEDGYSPKLEPTIKDSGDRTQFETGAVRDMREGKGRCDLMPLDILTEWALGTYDTSDIVSKIRQFMKAGDVFSLYDALTAFSKERYGHPISLILDVSIHFEQGAKKYGENNWQKGIPVKCYIDSAIRHYLKYLRDDDDEPHDRAFCWNLMCAIWTCEHMPELNSYAKEK